MTHLEEINGFVLGVVKKTFLGNMSKPLFIYGTLEKTHTQLNVIGRQINGVPDILRGYRVSEVEIEGEHYPVAVRDRKGKIAGRTINVTNDELEKIDAYEGDSYKRVQVKLNSGITAWVYARNVRNTKKYVFTAMTFFVLGGSVAVLGLISSNSFYRSPISVGSVLGEMSERKGIELLFVGDIMLSRGIGSIMEQTDKLFPFQLIRYETRSADIAFANLENPVSNSGRDSGKVYSFRADPESLLGLAWAGFDVVSLANNHIFDWGPDALLDTLNNLNNWSIKYVGAGGDLGQATSPVVIEKDGVKIAYLAYTQFAGNYGKSSKVAYIDEDLLLLDIGRVKESGVDIIAVSFHWGDEYETEHNSFQERIAKFSIDAGADIVVGHHPHVSQEAEKYKNGIIGYSLGNFIFDQNFSPETSKGLMLKVYVDETGLIGFDEKEIGFNEHFQPFILKQS